MEGCVYLINLLPRASEYRCKTSIVKSDVVRCMAVIIAILLLEAIH